MLRAFLEQEEEMRHASDEDPLFFDMVTWELISYADLFIKKYQARSTYRLAYPVILGGYVDQYQLTIPPSEFRELLARKGVNPFPDISKSDVKYIVDLRNHEKEYGPGPHLK